jgi:hypothetical protein
LPTGSRGLILPGRHAEGVATPGQITLANGRLGASSLLDRASERLASYEDRRLAKEIREAAGDLVNRIRLQGSTA